MTATTRELGPDHRGGGPPPLNDPPKSMHATTVARRCPTGGQSPGRRPDRRGTDGRHAGRPVAHPALRPLRTEAGFRAKTIAQPERASRWRVQTVIVEPPWTAQFLARLP